MPILGARPEVSDIAERLYQVLQPLAYADEANDWALLNYSEASIGSLQQVEDLVRDTDDGPGWSSVLDVTRAPYEGLPWLGQFVGLTTPGLLPGESQAAHDARVRAYITAVGGFGRGTPESIKAAVAQYLTGAKIVTLRERDTSPYHFDVRSRESQTPIEEWPTTNLLPNPSFETDLTGWNESSSGVTGNTVARVLEDLFPSRGLWAARLVATIAGGGWMGLQCSTGRAPVTPGKAYSGSGYVYNLGDARSYIARIAWYNGAGTNIGSLQYGGYHFANIGDVVRPFVAGVVAPATAATADLMIYTADVGTCWYEIDGTQIEEHSLVTPFTATSRASGTVNILNAIRAQKPGGLQFTYQVVPDWTYDDLDAAYATYNAIDAEFATYDDIDNNNP